MERNSDVMNSVLGAYKRNVIGSGFQIQAKTPSTELNKELEKLWKKWCKARNCDVTGTQSLNQMLRMAVERKNAASGVIPVIAALFVFKTCSPCRNRRTWINRNLQVK